jgi:4-hydroxy 2-oxovalerate aldolase
MIFVSNRRRFSGLEGFSPEKMIFTSNVIKRPEGAKTVNYTGLVNSLPYVSDNAGLMLLRLLVSLKAKKVLLAGFDGYSYQRDENYFDKSLLGADDSDRHMTDMRNEGIIKRLIKTRQELPLEFVTKSMYEKPVLK